MGKKKRWIVLGIVSIIFASSTSTFTQSDGDPLVTKSYVESKIDEIKGYVDEKISQVSSGDKKQEATMEIVELDQGDYLIAEEGTEIILRSGSAVAHGVKPDGGIADLTAGKDIDNMTDLLPANHLLLVPRSDGRGAYSLGRTVFVVRGNYQLK